MPFSPDDVVYEGYMLKCPQKPGLLKTKWSRRYFVLWRQSFHGSGRLEYFDDMHGYHNGTNKRLIPLRDCERVYQGSGDKSQPYVMEIVTPSGTHRLAINTQVELDLWMENIESVIQEMEVQRPPARSTGSMNRGSMVSAGHESTAQDFHFVAMTNSSDPFVSTSQQMIHPMISHASPQQSSGQIAHIVRSGVPSTIVPAVANNPLDEDCMRVRAVVDATPAAAKLQLHGEHTIAVTPTSIQFIGVVTGQVLAEWPLRLLRRYGSEYGTFFFEAGRRCSTGEGFFQTRTTMAGELYQQVSKNTQALVKKLSKSSLNATSPVKPPIRKGSLEEYSEARRFPDSVPQQRPHVKNTTPSDLAKAGYDFPTELAEARETFQAVALTETRPCNRTSHPGVTESGMMESERNPAPYNKTSHGGLLESETGGPYSEADTAPYNKTSHDTLVQSESRNPYSEPFGFADGPYSHTTHTDQNEGSIALADRQTKGSGMQPGGPYSTLTRQFPQETANEYHLSSGPSKAGPYSSLSRSSSADISGIMQAAGPVPVSTTSAEMAPQPYSNLARRASSDSSGAGEPIFQLDDTPGTGPYNKLAKRSSQGYNLAIPPVAKDNCPLTQSNNIGGEDVSDMSSEAAYKNIQPPPQRPPKPGERPTNFNPEDKNDPFNDFDHHHQGVPKQSTAVPNVRGDRGGEDWSDMSSEAAYKNIQPPPQRPPKPGERPTNFNLEDKNDPFNDSDHRHQGVPKQSTAVPNVRGDRGDCKFGSAKAAAISQGVGTEAPVRYDRVEGEEYLDEDGYDEVTAETRAAGDNGYANHPRQPISPSGPYDTVDHIEYFETQRRL